MEGEPVTGAESAAVYDHSEVMNPSFRLAVGADGSLPCRDLYVQTFARSEHGPDDWISQPEGQWHLLARILPQSIVTYPVHTNPHAQRYLRPRHGRIRTIILQGGEEHAMPDSPEAAVSLIEAALPWRASNDCAYGLGLTKELDAIWLGIQQITGVDTLIVTKDGETKLEGSAVVMPEGELDMLRHALDRANRHVRSRVQLAKTTHIRNTLLTQLIPERFPPIVQVGATGELVEVRLDRTRQSTATVRAQRRATVRAVRENAALIAHEAPEELMELHAEIERVTLASMIERYEGMLAQTLPEGRWQSFFETNIFILTMLFARPVRLLHTQFHAQGSSLSGSGAQVGDFLLGELGQSLAIVEIKKPSTMLMLNAAYRNSEVYGPSAELSGAITQVLYQQSALHSNWLAHQIRPELRDSRPDATKCVIIAGLTPTEERQRRSFEIFRNACKNVEVVTFDELLGKLRVLLQHLAPAS
ncbi:DUF4263 domain-containing protein (plasmid) [Cupriavidus sp. P-10]|uniref:Shedu immune nuclease family protein n=1 Tax=Cupriavidus sp. P-10 TaxID=2027911 RepID=UPI000ED24C27|nr:Shedu immune nuclease family protein [Cupriavidus sp. P-10]BDB29225.1 DUF4263 domain-containing protein [Cupriavidus sp. P-10]